MPKQQLTAISLFSGAGGDTVGLEAAGFKVIAYSEIWDKARKTHELNFPDSKLLGEAVDSDITKISDEEFAQYTGKIDLIFAGFPCQGFSHAGKKDLNDPRNKLFWDFVRATSIIKPKWIIGENVAGLLHRKSDDGNSMVKDIILKAFEEIGYTMAQPKILHAEDFGVPQQRRRVFFVGNNNGIDFHFPSPQRTKETFEPLTKILENTNKNSIIFDPEDVYEFDKCKSIITIDQGSTDKDSSDPHPFLKLRTKEKRISYKRRISPNHVELVDIHAPTKTIHCGYAFQPRLFVPIKQGNNYFAREFTINELAQIQSFPSHYRFFGNKNDIIKQIGNAVPPLLSKAIAEQILLLDQNLTKDTM